MKHKRNGFKTSLAWRLSFNKLNPLLYKGRYSGSRLGISWWQFSSFVLSICSIFNLSHTSKMITVIIVFQDSIVHSYIFVHIFYLSAKTAIYYFVLWKIMTYFFNSVNHWKHILFLFNCQASTVWCQVINHLNTEVFDFTSHMSLFVVKGTVSPKKIIWASHAVFNTESCMISYIFKRAFWKIEK